MKSRPILFSGPMVQAIINGAKTQTRRIVNPPTWLAQPDGALETMRTEPQKVWGIGGSGSVLNPRLKTWCCPYGVPGDRLVVKEAAWLWCERRPNGTTKTGRPKWHYVPLPSAPVHFCADHPKKPATSVVSPGTGNEWGWRKKPGRFLPRAASRLTLEVTEVRVQRLRDISEEDAQAEGIARAADGYWFNYAENGPTHQLGVDSFRSIWDSLNGKRPAAAWKDSPFVWCVSFKRVDA